MKTLLIIALLAAPIYGATNEEIEAQILALQSTLEEQKADSTVTVLDALVQGDAAYATLKSAGVTIVNQPHSNGNYDHVWVGVNFPLSEADESATTLKINLAIESIKGTAQSTRLRRRWAGEAEKRSASRG